MDVKKNLFIAERTNIIIPTHRALDKAAEIAKRDDKIGSTLKVGPADMDKQAAMHLRVGDLLDPQFSQLYQSWDKHQQNYSIITI